MTIEIRFLPDDVVTQAVAGESLLNVAERAGVSIPTGCLMGSCHACEVEIKEVGDVRACISAVPPGHESLTIHLFSDPSW